MRFEASPGHVILKIYKEPKQSKILMPDNARMDECPTFEIVSVGIGRVSNTGYKETIPYKVGDRVVVASGRALPISDSGEKLVVVDWLMIYAQAFTDRE